MTYKEQLRHQLWIERSEVFREQIDGGQCRCCGTQRNLTVHHKRYLRDGYLWEVPDEWLETLCWDCHQRRHVLEGAIRMLDTSDFLRWEIEIEVAKALKSGALCCGLDYCQCGPCQTKRDNCNLTSELEQRNADIKDLQAKLEKHEEDEGDDYMERARKDPFCFEHWL